MSDTMTGSVSSGNYVPNPVNVHDSTVEQGGGCLTPHLGVIPYSSSVWYWPGSAVVEGNILQVFSYKVVPDSKFVTEVPTTRQSSSPCAWLARAPAGQVTDQSAWEFFTDSTVDLPDCPLPPLPPWSNNFACARPMEFTKADSSPDGSPLAQLSVVPDGSGYLAGAFSWDTLSTSINALTADQPEGPWKRVDNANGTPHAIATFQPRTNDQFAYDARGRAAPRACQLDGRLRRQRSQRAAAGLHPLPGPVRSSERGSPRPSTQSRRVPTRMQPQASSMFVDGRSFVTQSRSRYS